LQDSTIKKRNTW